MSWSAELWRRCSLSSFTTRTALKIFSIAIILYQQWDRYDPTLKFGSWVRGIALNLARAELRRGKRYQALLDKYVEEMVVADVEAVGAESVRELRLQALRPCLLQVWVEHRRLIHWRFYDRVAYSRIAARTGRSVGSLEVLVHRVEGHLLTCIKRKLDQI